MSDLVHVQNKQAGLEAAAVEKRAVAERGEIETDAPHRMQPVVQRQRAFRTAVRAAPSTRSMPPIPSPVERQKAFRSSQDPREGLAEPNSETAATQAEPAPPISRSDAGLPDPLKTGIETLSGISVDDVKVHYRSSRPAQLHAHAFAEGTDIHLAPGQERHLPHEAWHVVQQKSGRAPATGWSGGTAINDDPALEREADRMGERALQGGAGATVPAVRRGAGAVQLRTKNPYSDASATGGASTAHHIIPDVMLSSSIERMGDEGDAIKRQFMPAFATLTLRRLLEADVDMGISYDGKNVTIKTVRADDADEVYRTPFGSLSGSQQEKIAINELGFAAFRTAYEAAAKGEATDPKLKGAQKTGLADTFYEWQAGNIFAGPSSEMRMEPGEKHEFDSDAAYITGGVQHVAALKVIYAALNKLEAEWKVAIALPEATLEQRQKKTGDKDRIKSSTKDELGKLAKLNAGTATPTAHDESLWYQVDAIKAQTLGQIEGKQRLGDASVTNRKLPRGLVKDLLKTKLSVHSDNSYKVLQAIERKAAFTPAPLLAKLTLAFSLTSTKHTDQIAVAGYPDSAIIIDKGPKGYRKSDVGDAANAALCAYFGA